MTDSNKPINVSKIIASLKTFITFVTKTMWRVKDTEVTRGQQRRNHFLKVVYLSVKRYVANRVQVRAKALTYSTVFSLVPILALLFAIARGFGFSNLVESLLRNGIALGGDTMDMVMQFIDSYLEHTHSGIFIGIGLIVLLWSIISLTGNIEQGMNQIWGVKKPRSMFRKVTDYFSMFLLLPFFVISLGGWSIFMSTIYQNISGQLFLSSFVNFIIELAPYVLSGLVFTGMFCFFPNTKVKFRHAIIPGLFTGSVFQAFFYFYINVQVKISAYNAIYGSFALIPLLLFFIMVSWCIILFGVELTYVSQNMQQYSFSEDVDNVSSRFGQFACVLLLSLICKRFREGGQPYTTSELAQEGDIPYRLAEQVLFELEEDGLICPIGATDAKTDAMRFMPTSDVSRLTVGQVLRTIDTNGSEDFKTDFSTRFAGQWNAVMQCKDACYNAGTDMLIVDL
jgi:membrane protein